MQLNEQVASSIQQLVKQFPDLQIHIVAVEDRETDYSAAENLNNAAGCDLFRVVQDHKLTNCIASFMSYTPNQSNGFSHIRRVKAPPGSVPFRESYLSEKHLYKFISFLRSEVRLAAANQDKLLKLIQDLSVTLAALVKDKPKPRATTLVNLFCTLFDGTVLDEVLVRFILANAVAEESAGSAALFASYRTQLKNLYKSADTLLSKDVRSAVGLSDKCITLPMNGLIVTGPSDLVTHAVHIKGRSFPNAALNIRYKKEDLKGGDLKGGDLKGVDVKGGDVKGGCDVKGGGDVKGGCDMLVPMLPFRETLFDSKSEDATMAEQCLRQWTRQLVGQLCHVDPMTDLVIYHVLGFNFQISQQTSFPDNVKQFYRQLALLMLRKKRTNSNVTELKWLKDGNLPTPSNGDIEYFKRGMRQICPVIGLTTSLQPFNVWYLMCQALGDAELTKAQLRHCQDESAIVVPPSSMSLVGALTYHMIPVGLALDPTCLITLDDLTLTGGFCFVPHGGCKPRNMLSEAAMKELLAKPETALCPMCYAQLDQKSFVHVPADQLIDPHAKKLLVLKDLTSQFEAVRPTTMATATATATTTATSGSPGSAGSGGKKGDMVLFLRGTVGCGKTTYTAQVVAAAQAKGYSCCVLNVDQYACVDNNAANGARRVTSDLAEFLSDQKMALKPRLVIVDTCGETTNVKKVFGQDLSSWKMIVKTPNYNSDAKNMSGYLDWSLYNVMSRAPCSEGCGFWLNPHGAGPEICRSVQKKSTGCVSEKWNRQLESASKWIQTRDSRHPQTVRAILC